MHKTHEKVGPTEIRRHRIDNKKWFARRYDLQRRVLDVSIAAVGTRPDNLASMVSVVSQLLSCGLVMGEARPTLRTYLQIGARAGLAFFQKLAAGRQPIAVDLGRGPIEVAGSPNLSMVSSGVWVFGYYFAVLAREPATSAALAEVSPKLFKKATNKVVPAYKDLYAEALIHFENKSRKLKKTLEECIHLLQTEKAESVFLPEAELFRQLCGEVAGRRQKSAPSFQDYLIAALRAYQRDLDNHPELKKGAAGVVALRPLGLAALAHDRGIAFDVESEFIPGFLVRGEFA